jgi:hypothetical protein
MALFAQAPEKIDFQAVIHNSSNQLLTHPAGGSNTSKRSLRICHRPLFTVGWNSRKGSQD